MHDLEVGDGLRGEGVQARLEVLLDVVDRDDDADPRHGRGDRYEAGGDAVSRSASARGAQAAAVATGMRRASRTRSGGGRAFGALRAAA